jgi:hypothetical protein
MDSKQIHLPILDVPGWLVPSRMADQLWMDDDGTGHRFLDMPVHEERKSLLEARWRGRAYLGPVKEDNSRDEFWGIPGKFDPAEELPWNA